MREHAVDSGARVVGVVAAALWGGGAPARRPAIGRDTRLHRGGAHRPLRARYVPTTFGAMQSRQAADVSNHASLVDVLVGIELIPSVGAELQRLCRAVPSQAHAGQHARSGRAHYDFRVRVHRAAPCRRAMPGPCWLRRLSATPDRFRPSPRARNDGVMGCRHLGDLLGPGQIWGPTSYVWSAQYKFISVGASRWPARSGRGSSRCPCAPPL